MSNITTFTTDSVSATPTIGVKVTIPKALINEFIDRGFVSIRNVVAQSPNKFFVAQGISAPTIKYSYESKIVYPLDVLE